MITGKQYNQLAQLNHVLAGTTWIWGTALFFGEHWLFLYAGVFAAAIKEFWYDERYESPEIRGSSFQDFIFYCVGLFGAVWIYWLKGLL
jgi:hypothetical protein